jgi:transposase
MAQHSVAGIDVSKDKLDVVLLDQGQQHAVFDNSSEGLKKLKRWLQKHCATRLHLCMEATGQYSDAPAAALYEAGYWVSIVNPARIKAFADSRMSRQKTDKTDALLIALFCQTQQPPLWTPPPPEQQALKAMVRHLQDVKAMRQQELNRLAVVSDAPTVQQALEHHIAFLTQQIADLEQGIRQHLEQHPHLKKQRDLLDSIPGLGDTIIPLLLAEIRDITAFDSAAQLAAYAGVTPRHYRSGSSVHGRTRISKRGNASLRASLYFPAMVALRHNPIIRAFGERLRATGHKGKAIIVAAMRKLLHLVYGVLKSQRPFDQNFALQAVTA